MITDNQAKEAIKTITEYCRQHPYVTECVGCALKTFCDNVQPDKCPEDWPRYLD